jgi:hypothetical protein
MEKELDFFPYQTKKQSAECRVPLNDATASGYFGTERATSCPSLMGMKLWISAGTSAANGVSAGFPVGA